MARAALCHMSKNTMWLGWQSSYISERFERNTTHSSWKGTMTAQPHSQAFFHLRVKLNEGVDKWREKAWPIFAHNKLHRRHHAYGGDIFRYSLHIYIHNKVSLKSCVFYVSCTKMDQAFSGTVGCQMRDTRGGRHWLGCAREETSV